MSTPTSAPDPQDGSNAAPVTHQPTEARSRRRPGRPPAGSEDKRERILAEAVHLFGVRGYAGTSLGDIARAADITKAGLLHHFAGKDDLFAQVLERRDAEDDSAFMADVSSCWDAMDAFVRLVEYNTTKRDLVAIYTAMAPSVADVGHPAREWMIGHLEGSVERMVRLLEEGKATGIVRPEAPSALIARSLVALSDGLQIQWLAATAAHAEAPPALATTMVQEMRLYVDGVRQRWALPDDADGADDPGGS